MAEPERPADLNPYAPPEAPIGLPPIEQGGSASEAEVIRRKYLGHEASVRSIGSLHFLAAFFCVLGLFMAVVSNPGLITGAFVALFAYHAALGWGLTRLKPWARWVDAILVGLVLLGLIAGIGRGLIYAAENRPQDILPVSLIWGTFSLIPAYIFYLLVGRKSSVVFSPEYRDVIARTPQVKHKTSPVVWVVLLLALLGVAVALLLGVG